jgi:hypothetical protein
MLFTVFAGVHNLNLINSYTTGSLDAQMFPYFVKLWEMQIHIHGNSICCPLLG